MASTSPASPSRRSVLLDGERGRPELFALFMTGVGITHFVAPQFFERIVPKWIGHEKELVFWSGVAEVATGVLVAVPRTRRLGGWLGVATVIAVYPANVQMALDAGAPTDAEGIFSWLRLPLQYPIIRWALRLARDR